MFMLEWKKIDRERGKVMQISRKYQLIAPVIVWVLGMIQIIRYIMLGNMAALLTVVLLEVWFGMTSYAAYRGKFPALLIMVGIGAAVCYVFTNHAETTLFNVIYIFQAAAALLGGILGTAVMLRKKERPDKKWISPVAAVLVMVLAFLAVWGVQFFRVRSTEAVKDEVWGVPKKFDSVPATAQGTVEELTYDTKAYATDQRDVQKRAMVYLPAGYDESKKYNILYLMHGTGDDEEYWLVTHPENKVMLDRLIEQEVIEPLIVVTPTFYVEDDCMDGLDALTYSFREELRNELMPAVETRYSTYADSASEEDFSASRDHRAFAGLSRGAVTTIHSVICGSLDYFSWFGTFSGSRTSADYFREKLQTEEFKDLPIHYWYVSTGNFDFALPGQVEDYKGLLAVEPRMQEGVNISFDTYPMRYHSAGNWHISLYNCLQKIFTDQTAQ